GARLAPLTTVALLRYRGGFMMVARNWWGSVSAGAPVGAVWVAGCLLTHSRFWGAGEDCPQVQNGGHFYSSLPLDDTLRMFMQGSADLLAIGDRMKPAVKTACAHIATDLGASDSWSARGDGDESITNQDHTGACDVAAAKIGPIMQQAANANFALIWTHG